MLYSLTEKEKREPRTSTDFRKGRDTSQEKKGKKSTTHHKQGKKNITITGETILGGPHCLRYGKRTKSMSIFTSPEEGWEILPRKRLPFGLSLKQASHKKRTDLFS